MGKIEAWIAKLTHNDHYTLWTDSGQAVRDGAESWQRYPRPQLRRNSWLSLNGTWTLNGNFIKVPFPPQSQLSGYQGKIGPRLMYEKTFVVPEDFVQPRILLHFGAVDQVAEVWLNDEYLGKHEGGYLPFSFDITAHVRRGEENRVKVRATDTLSHLYPYGKQRRRRGGMWYTPVSGIWQSVWIENVPEKYIEAVKLIPDLEGADIVLRMAGGPVLTGMDATDTDREEIRLPEGLGQDIRQAEGDQKEEYQKGVVVSIQLENGETVSRFFKGSRGRIDMTSLVLADGSKYVPVYWTPENPHLYPITIKTGMDKVESYFALRTVAIEEKDGINRVCLNGQPIFMHGVLDQGYYCDGIYLPATEEEYDRDILRMKELGYNLLRKHIKVEPEYFYYACDKLGMLVMQDMVNNGPYHYVRETVLPTMGFKRKLDVLTGAGSARKRFFVKHMDDTVKHLYNHPSIVAYTIFNEAWGQFHSDRLYSRMKVLDPTRLVDSTSGWFAQKKNDFDSEHIYFKVIPLTPGKRPLFVSECGGYTMLAEDHFYNKYKQYGYGACQDSQELTDKIEHMYRVMILPAISRGLCGCIYTQVSDVEDEINGLYTYDRKVCKVVKKQMFQLAEEMKAQVKPGT